MRVKCNAGLDIYYNGENAHIIVPGEAKTLETKTAVEIPAGHVGLVMIRSGLGFKGLTLINGVGVIDEDYRGDIGLKVVNHGDEPILIKPKDRIAQMEIVPYVQENIELVDELTETERGSNGFGSTGTH